MDMDRKEQLDLLRRNQPSSHRDPARQAAAGSGTTKTISKVTGGLLMKMNKSIDFNKMFNCAFIFF